MEYNKITKNKPNNLISIHKEHEKILQEKMKRIAYKYKLTKEDCRLWIQREKVDEKWKDNFMVTLGGSKLQQCGGNLFFWRQLKVRSDKNPEIILKALLFDLGYNYFTDEDAHGGGMFIGKDWKNFAYCYVSPDFPEGYWQNHSLEVNPDIIKT